MSPYAVRKALENTTTSIGDVPADKLTTGHGLLQVDRLASLFWVIKSCFECNFFYFECDMNVTSLSCRAYEYVRQAKGFPSVSYRVSINQVGKSSEPFTFFLSKLVASF